MTKEAKQRTDAGIVALRDSLFSFIGKPESFYDARVIANLKEQFDEICDQAKSYNTVKAELEAMKKRWKEAEKDLTETIFRGAKHKKERDALYALIEGLKLWDINGASKEISEAWGRLNDEIVERLQTQAQTIREGK